MRVGATAVLTAMVLVVAACGNSESSGGTPDRDDTPSTAGEQVAVDEPGVTDTEIRVGGVASTTNPLGGKFGTAFDGVRAYFEMVNADGGVHGRQLVLAAERDDKAVGNDAEVQGLIEQDQVFAVLPIATLLFTGADRLAREGVPAFGWTINPEWEGTEEQPKENLFGQNGSFLCLGCEQPFAAYLAQHAERTRVGVLAYNVPQSAQCADGWERTFDVYGDDAGVQVAFVDRSLSYGTTDLSVQVSQMKKADVDLVMTCMDTNAVVTLARELKKQRLDAIQFLPNGYDHELLDEYGDLFEGSYVYTSFVPIEFEPRPDAMATYLEWIEETGGEVTENSLVGWINADLFVKGLREAGPDFSREKLVDALNEMTDYDAGGLLAGVDWTIAHHTREDATCSAVMRIEDSEFVPVTLEDGKPFTCLALGTDTVEASAR